MTSERLQTRDVEPRAGPPRRGKCAGALDMVDLLAGGREYPPWASKLDDALPGRLSGVAVADEVVERVTGVGDFELPVAPPGSSEQRRLDSRTGDRLAVRDQRRPQGGTGAV